MSLEKFSIKVVQLVFTLFLVLFTISSFFFSAFRDSLTNKAFYEYFPVISFLVAAVLVATLYLLKKKGFLKQFDSKKNLAIFLVLALFLALYWNISNPHGLYDVDDAYNVMRSARAFVEHNYGPISYRTYMNTYPNNFGLFTYDALLVKLFAYRAESAFRFISTIFMLIAYFYLYKILELFTDDEEIKNILVFLFYLTPQLIFYTYFVYGNVLSYSLGNMSLYYFIKYYRDDKKLNLFLAILFVVSSIFIKNNSAIILVAEVIFLFVKMIEKRKPILILVMVLMFASFYAVTEGVISIYENISDTSYDNRLPKICWIAYGLNYEEHNPGGYTNELEVYYAQNDYVSEFVALRAEQFIDRVLEAFKDRPHLIPRFYMQKMLVAWANPEFEIFNQYAKVDLKGFNKDLVFGKSHEVFKQYLDGTESVIALGLFVYLIKHLFKEKDFTKLLLPTVIIGGFLFHSFWEIKAIYLYQYYFLLLPYAAIGLSTLLNRKRG